MSDAKYRAICACGATSKAVPSELVAGDWADDHADRHRGYCRDDVDVEEVDDAE